MCADTATHAPPCPKCGAHSSGDASSCPGCGLATARIAAYTEARDAAVPDPVHQAWARLGERWDDDARHDELLRLVVTNHCYAWAAGRYRTREGDVTAQRQLARLRRAAEVTLLASAAVRPDAGARPYRAATGVLAILVVVIAAGLLYATVIRARGTAPDAGPRSRAAPAQTGTVRTLEPGHPVSSSTIK